MDELKKVLSGTIPGWCKRVVKDIGRGINRFSMIRENDEVLLGVSGGKDSLALAFALSLRKRWLPIDYRLRALVIDWREYPMGEAAAESLNSFFDLLEIPCEIVQAHMFAESFEGRFDCYLCSRNRKRILFETAERQGIRKIALGHHLDDIVQTTLINLFLRGSFTTMMPVQRFFNGALEVIRPMCETYEKDIQKIVTRLELPVYEIDCPYKTTNIREQMKPILMQLQKIDKQVKEHIYNAHFNIGGEYSDFADLVPPKA